MYGVHGIPEFTPVEFTERGHARGNGSPEHGVHGGKVVNPIRVIRVRDRIKEAPF